MQVNNQLAEEFIPQDTKHLQIQSVCAFMEVFNYHILPYGTFVTQGLSGWKNPAFKGCKIISFNTAVRLHNFESIDWHGDNFSEPFSTDKYTFNKARASKIVDKAFLQATRYGSILCHKHLVKFTDPAYQYIFLEDSK